jgi:hypothetical protein
VKTPCIYCMLKSWLSEQKPFEEDVELRNPPSLRTIFVFSSSRAPLYINKQRFIQRMAYPLLYQCKKGVNNNANCEYFKVRAATFVLCCFLLRAAAVRRCGVSFVSSVHTQPTINNHHTHSVY